LHSDFEITKIEIPEHSLLCEELFMLCDFRYLEQVIPSEFGARQPPWFLFSPSYWRTYTANEESVTYQVSDVFLIFLVLDLNAGD
jgi:hypothetical protein